MPNSAASLRLANPERRTGRPRRQDSYEKVSFTISTALLNEIDRRAQEWGMNRSGTVARIVESQLDGISSENYVRMKRILVEINELLSERRAG